jgi:cytoskeletal protein RodZ
MNKKILITVAIILSLLLVAGIFVLLVVFKQSTPPNQPQNTNQNPGQSSGFPITNPPGSSTSTSGTSGTNTIQIPISSGSKITVKDFTSAPTTLKDPSNPGNYYLSGGADVAVTKAPYQIFYTASDGSFGITLFQEPLGDNRKKAEQELQASLGLSNDLMCSLTYYLTAGPGVSAKYSNVNLGFSFCPGATQLP